MFLHAWWPAFKRSPPPSPTLLASRQRRTRVWRHRKARNFVFWVIIRTQTLASGTRSAFRLARRRAPWALLCFCTLAGRRSSARLRKARSLSPRLIRVGLMSGGTEKAKLCVQGAIRTQTLASGARSAFRVARRRAAWALLWFCTPGGHRSSARLRQARPSSPRVISDGPGSGSTEKREIVCFR